MISIISQDQVISESSLQERKSEASGGYAASVPPPTIQSARYGKHERNVVDIWQAEEKSPTPLVLVIHGGGWRGGAKERVDR
ncbi:MAG: hypothetical protein MPJ22_05855, partial [Pirellulales bacterium]|nr:hypothetical protein [Pirellulales bacterium]